MQSFVNFNFQISLSLTICFAASVLAQYLWIKAGCPKGIWSKLWCCFIIPPADNSFSVLPLFHCNTPQGHFGLLWRALKDNSINISNSCEQNILTAMPENLKYLLENSQDETYPYKFSTRGKSSSWYRDPLKEPKTYCLFSVLVIL